MERFELLIYNHHGIYIPQMFAQTYIMDDWHVSQDDADILLEGPEHEWYWETWDDVLANAYCEMNGKRYTLYLGESGDVFAELKMTDEELAQWVADWSLDNATEERREAFRAWYVDNSDKYDLRDEWEARRTIKAFEEEYDNA